MQFLESDVYIGAIALGALIFNFIYWGLGFLRMGTSGFTAQAWGRRDLPETILVFSRAALIALCIGIVLLILQRPIEKLSFMILKGESEVEQLAMAYFRIRVWAAPAALIQFALLGFSPAYIILNKVMGNHGLWLAFILFMLARSITMGMMAKRAVFSKVS